MKPSNAYRVETHRNTVEAYRHFDQRSFLAESHELLVEVMRHPVTTGIVFLMVGLGLFGWVSTFLL